MKKAATLGLAVATTGLMITQSVSAQIIARETFTYFNLPSGDFVNGLNGGIGWGGAWSASFTAGEDPAIKFAGTPFPGYGNTQPVLQFRADYRNAIRPLDTSALGVFGSLGYLNGDSKIGADNTELWISVYHQRTVNPTGGNDAALVLQRNGANIVTARKAFTDSDPHLYVVHIQFAAGADTVTTYFDPNLSAAPTGGIVSSVADASFDGIRLTGLFAGSQTSFATIVFDHIKVGATAADIGFSPMSDPVTIVSSSFDLDANTATVTFTSNPAFEYKVKGSGNLDGFELDLSGPITPAPATTQTTTTVNIPEATSFFLRVEETQP